MTIKKTRGGRRPKKLPKKEGGQQMLIRELIRHLGGRKGITLKVRKVLGEDFHKQNFVNWRDRGLVPLEWCRAVAAALKISPYALNYRGMCTVNEPRPWPEAVKSCPLYKEVIAKILAAKAP